MQAIFKGSDFHANLKTTYTVYHIEVRGNIWSILITTGKLNRITVLKKTNNPFGTVGKDYNDFNAAAANYKSPEMKTALMLVELAEQERTSQIVKSN